MQFGGRNPKKKKRRRPNSTTPGFEHPHGPDAAFGVLWRVI